MTPYLLGQIAGNLLLVLLPLHFIVKANSSRRTKTIASLVLVFVVFGLFGELSMSIQKRSKASPTAGTSSQHVDRLGTSFAPADGSFSVKFPQYPTTQTDTQDANGLQVQHDSYVAANSSNDTKYSVEVLTYPAYTDYIRDHQRQILQQSMQQVNDRYSAHVVTPGNAGQYFCGFSASKEHFTAATNGVSSDGYALVVLDYGKEYVLLSFGRNAANFDSFVKSFVPQGGCKYSTTL